MSRINDANRLIRQQILQQQLQSNNVEEKVDDNKQTENMTSDDNEGIQQNEKKEFVERGSELQENMELIACRGRSSLRRSNFSQTRALGRNSETQSFFRSPRKIKNTGDKNKNQELTENTSTLSDESISTESIEGVVNVGGYYYFGDTPADGQIGDKFYEHGQLANGEVNGVIYVNGLVFADVAQKTIKSIQKAILSAINADTNYQEYINSESEEKTFSGVLDFSLDAKSGSANVTIDKDGNVLEVAEGVLTEYSEENSEEIKSKEIFEIDENGVWDYTEEIYGKNFSDEYTCLLSVNANNRVTESAQAQSASIANTSGNATSGGGRVVTATVNTQDYAQVNLDQVVKTGVISGMNSLGNTANNYYNQYSSLKTSIINELQNEIKQIGNCNFFINKIKGLANVNTLSNYMNDFSMKKGMLNNYKKQEAFSYDICIDSDYGIRYTAHPVPDGYAETFDLFKNGILVAHIDKINGTIEKAIGYDKTSNSTKAVTNIPKINKNIYECKNNNEYKIYEEYNGLITITKQTGSTVVNIKNGKQDGINYDICIKTEGGLKYGYEEYSVPDGVCFSNEFLQSINCKPEDGIYRNFAKVVYLGKEKIVCETFQNAQGGNNNAYNVEKRTKYEGDAIKEQYYIAQSISNTNYCEYNGKKLELFDVKYKTKENGRALKTISELSYKSNQNGQKSTMSAKEYIFIPATQSNLIKSEVYEEKNVTYATQNNNGIVKPVGVVEFHKKTTEYEPANYNGEITSIVKHSVSQFGLSGQGYGRIETTSNGLKQQRQSVSANGKKVITTTRDLSLDSRSDGFVFDIKQGGIGDCWFLACLWWLGTQNIDLTKSEEGKSPIIKWNSDGSATVTLYRKNPPIVSYTQTVTKEDLEKKVYMIDGKTEILFMSGDKTAKALEIAMLKEGGRMGDAHGGTVEDFMRVLFGPQFNSRKVTKWGGNMTNADLEKCTYITITPEQIIRSGLPYKEKPMPESTYHVGYLNDALTGETIELPSKHTLSVINVDTVNNVVIVANPWNNFEKTYALPLDWVKCYMNADIYIPDENLNKTLNSMKVVVENNMNLNSMGGNEYFIPVEPEMSR